MAGGKSEEREGGINIITKGNVPFSPKEIHIDSPEQA